MNEPRTILVVDDHPLFRKALVGLVQDRRPGDRVMAAATAEEGLHKLNGAGADLVLLDLGLPGAAGVDAISLFRRACDGLILVVSASENRPEVAAATRAGARLVISKGVAMETLGDLIDQALAGTIPEQKWVRPAGTLNFGDEAAPGLTPRQQEIAALLMGGHSNKEIGIRLGLAEITVKTHLTAMFRTLGVVNRTQAVVAMRRLGIDTAQAGAGLHA